MKVCWGTCTLTSVFSTEEGMHVKMCQLHSLWQAMASKVGQNYMPSYMSASILCHSAAQWQLLVCQEVLRSASMYIHSQR